MTKTVRVRIEHDGLIVQGDEIAADRRARLFFGTILVADPLPNGWHCPKRREPIDSLLLVVDRWLRRNGWTSEASGDANSVLEREAERLRSFERTSIAAGELRAGNLRVDPSQVHEALTNAGWNFGERQLRDHQERGLVHALTVRNAANFSVPGSGKTVTTLAAFAVHRQEDTVDLMIVVGPLSSFGPWEHETAASLPDSAHARRIRGTSSARRAAYGAAQSGDILLISYATAASDLSYLIDLCREYRVMLVVDESHRIKRFRGGTWAPRLIQLAPHARYRTVLSGTPMPQDGRDLFSQLNVLWPGYELTGPPNAFAGQVDVDLPGVLERVVPFTSRTPKSALGLRDYEIIKHDVPLQGTQAEIYDLIQSQFRRALEDEPDWRDKLEVLRRARPMRLLQAATNPDLLNGTDRNFRLPPLRSNPTLMERLARFGADDRAIKHAAALEVLADIVSQGGKAVCWSNFLVNLDQFAEYVRTELGISVFQVDGRIPASDDPINEAVRVSEDGSKTREELVERFLQCKDPAVLVTNPAVMSESVSLHSSCHNALYLDRTWNCALFLQSIDRIHRLGLPPDVTVRVHIFQATLDGRPTVDGVIDASLSQKETAMRVLLEGAELMPIRLSLDPAEDAEGDADDLALLLRHLLGQ
jgi:SNF2 family DNA or RNA helicase